jgi:hypothetical protein
MKNSSIYFYTRILRLIATCFQVCFILWLFCSCIETIWKTAHYTLVVKVLSYLRPSLFIDRKGWSVSNIWSGVNVELLYIWTNINCTHKSQKIWIFYQWTLRNFIFMQNYELSFMSKWTHSFALYSPMG